MHVTFCGDVFELKIENKNENLTRSKDLFFRKGTTLCFSFQLHHVGFVLSRSLSRVSISNFDPLASSLYLAIPEATFFTLSF